MPGYRLTLSFILRCRRVWSGLGFAYTVLIHGSKWMYCSISVARLLNSRDKALSPTVVEFKYFRAGQGQRCKRCNIILFSLLAVNSDAKTLRQIAVLIKTISRAVACVWSGVGMCNCLHGYHESNKWVRQGRYLLWPERIYDICSRYFGNKIH